MTFNMDLKMNRKFWALTLLSVSALASASMFAQPPGGFGRGGSGGPGGPNREDRKIVKEYDKDENGWLNNDERKVARAALKDERSEGGGERGFGGPGRGGPGGGRGRRSEPGSPGPEVSQDNVSVYPKKSLYDTTTLRTFFIEFENDDWEMELEDFHGTDVDVAAKVTVDGKSYPGVGVHFRGMSSYNHVQRGSKRSFNLDFNMVDKDQRIDGYKTLNLLNCHGDPSMMSTVLYSHIARQYIPTPKANFVHVVVNGKSWGLFSSVQQFDKKFLAENFDGSKGTRWKVNGSPWADGGLRYLGEDLEEYKSRFDMKSNDGKKEWSALVKLCKTLNETPVEQLKEALEPMLDIDGALKFLALDVALVNGDGYWTRASDYSLFREESGKFHILPHDMNEAFALSGRGGGGPSRGGPGGGRGDRDRGDRDGGGRGFPGFGPPPDDRGQGGRGERERGGRDDRGREPRGREGGGRGPGFGFGPPPGGDRGFGGPGGGPGGGGPGHGGVDLDPLVGLDNERMPLRSRLLAVPELRERYLSYVKQIAEESLNWKTLGPVVAAHRELISETVKADTRKLTSFDAFVSSTGTDTEGEQMSLKKFAQERSEYLLSK